MPHSARRLGSALAFPARRAEVEAMQHGGGIILALALVIGAVVGLVVGQGTIGILVGLGLGLVAVVVVAWRDDRRKR